MTLATIRTQLRTRFGFSPNDPLFTDDIVNRQINLAQRKIARAHDWWWATSEVTVENDTGADVTVWPAQFSTPNDLLQVRAVSHVFCSLDGDYWLPIERMSRADALAAGGGRTVSSGLPVAWAAVALTGDAAAGHRQQVGLEFAPPLPDGAWIRFQMAVDTVDLDDDADTPLLWPPQFVDLIVELAGTALMRQRKEAKVARRGQSFLALAARAAQEWLRLARIRFAKPYEGAGFSKERGS